MNLTRRELFQLGGVAALAVAVPSALHKVLDAITPAEDLPLILGDGDHDDTAGIQAALDGKPYRDPRGMVRVAPGGHAISFLGTYLITDTLVLDRPNVHVPGTLFVDHSHPAIDRPALLLERGANYCMFGFIHCIRCAGACIQFGRPKPEVMISRIEGGPGASRLYTVPLDQNARRLTHGGAGWTRS